MKIYDTQVSALEEDCEARYERLLLDFVRAEVGPAAGECVTNVHIRVGIAEARSLGLVTERQVGCYVMGRVLHGDAFFRAAADQRTTLADPCTAPEAKLRRLLELLEACESAFRDREREPGPDTLPEVIVSRTGTIRCGLFCERLDDVRDEVVRACDALDRDSAPIGVGHARALRLLADAMVEADAPTSAAPLLARAAAERAIVPADALLDAELLLTRAKLDFAESRSAECRRKLDQLLATLPEGPRFSRVRAEALFYRGKRAVLRGEFFVGCRDLDAAAELAPFGEPDGTILQVDILFARATATFLAGRRIDAEVFANAAFQIASAHLSGEVLVVRKARVLRDDVRSACATRTSSSRSVAHG